MAKTLRSEVLPQLVIDGSFQRDAKDGRKYARSIANHDQLSANLSSEILMSSFELPSRVSLLTACGAIL